MINSFANLIKKNIKKKHEKIYKKKAIKVKAHKEKCVQKKKKQKNMARHLKKNEAHNASVVESTNYGNVINRAQLLPFVCCYEVKLTSLQRHLVAAV